MTQSNGRKAVIAWLIAGTLDIGYAAVSSVMSGGTIGAMLHFVASGPFGDGVKDMGLAGSLLGLLTHYSIMAVMTLVFALVVRQVPALTRLPWWLTGAVYGLILYCFMYGVVLTSRFGAPFPNPDMTKLLLGLFPHIVFIGLPIAWLLARPQKG